MKHGYSELKRGTRQACDWKVYAACVAKDICCFLSFPYEVDCYVFKEVWAYNWRYKVLSYSDSRGLDSRLKAFVLPIVAKLQQGMSRVVLAKNASLFCWAFSPLEFGMKKRKELYQRYTVAHDNADFYTQAMLKFWEAWVWREKFQAWAGNRA